MDTRVEKTLAKLKLNRFEPYYVENREEAFKLATSFLTDGEKVSSGGSLTLKEIGLIDYIQSDKFDFKDIYAAKTEEEQQEALAYRFFCNTFFSSSNAITENGELYNVDGRCTRVAPLICGPKQVIVIAGTNKLVKDIDEARKRVQTIAGPLNAKRFNLETPCVIDGVCHNCKHAQRICCSEVITCFNRTPNRIKVILVGESLGM